MVQSHITTALSAARQQGGAAALTPTDLPETIDQAYALAFSQVPQPAAWKIGGANPWSRKVFGNSVCFYGPLHAHEVYNAKAHPHLTGLRAPLAEPEVMLRLGPDRSTASLAAFDRMALGIEIPATVLPDPLKPLLIGQICDRAGAGALWIGPEMPIDTETLEIPFEIGFGKSGAAQDTIGSSSNVIGGPIGAALEFLTLAQAAGAPLLPGQWIATGGLCPAIPASPGDRFILTGWSQKLEMICT